MTWQAFYVTSKKKNWMLHTGTEIRILQTEIAAQKDHYTGTEPHMHMQYYLIHLKLWQERSPLKGGGMVQGEEMAMGE